MEDGILKNPPVVASIPDKESYVVLDGANRALAFVNLGIPHIVAQLVAYKGSGVELDTWYHVVAGMDIADFEAALTKVTGLHLKVCNLEEARQGCSIYYQCRGSTHGQKHIQFTQARYPFVEWSGQCLQR
jgi:hypothetical protein